MGMLLSKFFFHSLIIFHILCMPLSLFGQENEVQYEVKILDIEDSSLLKDLQESSEMIKMQKHPPKSEVSLKRRAESDIPNLIKVLHNYAYYNAQVVTS